MSASSEINAEKWGGWVPAGFPEITHLTEPFWRALRAHKLVIQKCGECKEHQWYPRAICIHCGSQKLEWTEIEGKGTIYSYAVINMVVGNSPLWGQEIPFALGLIDLDEGPRMYGKMTGCDLTEVQIGKPVRAAFIDLQPDLTIVGFTPAK
jgi:uncharacterized OB-fold protein